MIYTYIVIQTDINECGEVNDCQQTCMNTEGSYSCSCDEGFSLADDGRTCTGNIIMKIKNGQCLVRTGRLSGYTYQCTAYWGGDSFP